MNQGAILRPIGVLGIFCFGALMMTRLLALLTALCCAVVSPGFAGDVPERIVSAAPSTTEILFALGLGDRVVGVTSFCDFPEEAKKKPKIGGMSNPSLEAVVGLKPDVVVVTTDGNPKEFEERVRSLKIRTYIFTARKLSELPRGIRLMGSAFGVKDRAEHVALDIERAIGTYKDRKRQAREKALFVIWPEPLIVAGPGTAVDDALTLLGIENIAAKAKAPYPKYSIEEIIHQSPDVIIFGWMNADMNDVIQGLLKKIRMVPAVKSGKVCYVGDGLYRLTPKVTQGIEELSRCLE